jgi:acetolactate synthase small subunit
MTFVAHLENSPGVLARVETLFRRQNLALTSLTLAESSSAGYLVTVEAPVPADTADLVLKQFRRLVDVRNVTLKES